MHLGSDTHTMRVHAMSSNLTMLYTKFSILMGNVGREWLINMTTMEFTTIKVVSFCLQLPV